MKSNNGSKVKLDEEMYEKSLTSLIKKEYFPNIGKYDEVVGFGIIPRPVNSNRNIEESEEESEDVKDKASNTVDKFFNVFESEDNRSFHTLQDSETKEKRNVISRLYNIPENALMPPPKKVEKKMILPPKSSENDSDKDKQIAVIQEEENIFSTDNLGRTNYFYNTLMFPSNQSFVHKPKEKKSLLDEATEVTDEFKKQVIPENTRFCETTKKRMSKDISRASSRKAEVLKRRILTRGRKNKNVILQKKHEARTESYNLDDLLSSSKKRNDLSIPSIPKPYSIPVNEDPKKMKIDPPMTWGRILQTPVSVIAATPSTGFSIKQNSKREKIAIQLTSKLNKKKKRRPKKRSGLSTCTSTISLSVAERRKLALTPAAQKLAETIERRRRNAGNPSLSVLGKRKRDMNFDMKSVQRIRKKRKK